MTAWILKKDTLRSPHTSIKNYNCGYRRSKLSNEEDIDEQIMRDSCKRKARSYIKSLSRMLTLQWKDAQTQQESAEI